MPPLSLLLPFQSGAPLPGLGMTHRIVSPDYSWRAWQVPYTAFLSRGSKASFSFAVQTSACSMGNTRLSASLLWGGLRFGLSGYPDESQWETT